MSQNKSIAEDVAFLPKLLSGELRLPSPRIRQAGVPAPKKLVGLK